jgi:hypothetical protein
MCIYLVDELDELYRFACIEQEQNLRRQIEQAQEEYKSLLNEYVSSSGVRTQTR